MGNVCKRLKKCVLPLLVLGMLNSSMAACAAAEPVTAAEPIAAAVPNAAAPSAAVRAAMALSPTGSTVTSPVLQQSAAFDAQSKWDQMNGHFLLAAATVGTPPDGVVLSMDVLVRASAAPRFKGRMNLEPVLLVGSERRWVKSNLPAQVRAINFKEKVTRDGAEWYRTRVSVTFTGTVQAHVNGVLTSGVPYRQAVNQPVTGVEVYVSGTLCDYRGTLRVENPSFDYRVSTEDGVSVRSTVSRAAVTPLSLNGNALTFGDGSQKTLPNVTLCDPSATAAAVNTARYLAAVGSSDSVIFGHQDSPWQKAGTEASPLNGLTDSDIEDITGSPAGMVGFDGGSLTGAEFSAALWNRKFVPKGKAAIDTAALGEAAANVKALAALSNDCLERGALVTLSCHMPNFALVKQNAAYQPGKDPAWAKYDFNSSSVRDTGARADILPGGAHNAAFTAYLDMVADYASQVRGAVLFRPFHEGTGQWCWWGSKAYDAAAYQKIFRYTVEYLRDTKQVHNLIYVYSPVAGNVEEAIKRYPGDGYVDIIGVDNYQIVPQVSSSKWFADFASELAQLGDFAGRHGKLLAVAEVGVNASVPDAGDVATGFSRANCPERQWFEKLLNVVSASRACYVLSWMNNEEIFYTPFVRAVNADGSLSGHELTDDFLKFYNDRRSIFAVDHAGIVQGLRS